MTKIFQKSLASVLALALCLTALITASATVSADASTTTATLFYEVSPEAPKAGDTVTVKLKASGFDTVAGADIYSTYSANITDGVLAWGLAEGQLGVNADVSHENNTIKMILEGASQNGVLDPITTLLADGTTLYTFTFTAGEAGTKYDFGFADDTKVRFCTSGEQEVTVAAAAKTVTVAENEIVPVEETEVSFIPGIRCTTTPEISYAVLGNALTKYPDFYIEINRQTCNANYDLIDAPAVKLYKKDIESYNNGALYAAYCSGIPMYELNVPITAQIWFLNSDGKEVAYSKSTVNSLADLAKQYFNAATDDKTKTVYTDIINLATEGQLFFTKNLTVGNLSNVALANNGFESSYATPDSAIQNFTSVANTTETGSVGFYGNYLALNASTGISYIITGASGIEPANLRFEVSYYDEVLSKTISANVTAAESDIVLSLGGGMYSYTFDQIALYDTDKVITCKIYNGNDLLITNTYSIESYISTNLNTAPTQTALLKQIAKLGVSSRAYFAK